MAKTLFGGGYTLPTLDAAAIAAMIAAVPASGRVQAGPFPALPRRPRAPVRSVSLRRSRRIAASGLLPPHLACQFRPSEQAVLAVIGDRVRQHGHCDLFIDQIAGLAGVSRTTVQNTLRLAERLGLLSRQIRRLRGHAKRCRTNVLRVVSLEWSAWLSKRKGRVTEVCSLTPVSGTYTSQEKRLCDGRMTPLGEPRPGRDSGGRTVPSR